MKKHTFTLLLGWLLLLASNLMAQNKEGLFRLKEGDWFEVQINDYNKHPCSDSTITSHLLRYKLVKTLPNSNQKYNISIEHIKVWDNPSKWKFLGYDSYYPPFVENKTASKTKNQFLLEISPLGRIVQFNPLKTNKFRSIILNEVGSVYGRKSFMMTEQDMKDSLTVRNLSSLFMLSVGRTDFKKQTGLYKYLTASLISKIETKAHGVIQANILFKDSVSVKVLYQNNKNIPLVINLPDIQFVLTKASFPLESNTFIYGKLENLPNENMEITMDGDTSLHNFPSIKFQSLADGSFNCPIFLNRPLQLNIMIGKKELTTFLVPGDTLNISNIAYLINNLVSNKTQGADPIEYLFDSKDITEDHFETAEYNTMLSNEMFYYQAHIKSDESFQTIVIDSKDLDYKAKKLINKYEGKASKICIEYFRKDWNYFLATEKLLFYRNSRLILNKKSYKEVLTTKDFPTDFFLTIDTMEIVMNPFEWNNSYQNFLSESQLIKQERLGYSIGIWRHGNFRENYFFSQASLRGYPLYKYLFDYMMTELKSGKTDINYIKPFYLDFINNCNDPSMVEPLKKTYEIAEMFVPGKIFPSQLFKLANGKNISIEEYKGKAVFLYISRQLTDSSPYFDLVKKTNPEEMEFIFMLGDNENHEDIIQMTGLASLPNVKILYLDEKCLDIMPKDHRGRSFTLDKWSRIVDNYLPNLISDQLNIDFPNFPELLRKAIDAKRYSKAEQSAMLKTAGWSLGSILFTVMVGFGIYRVRIRRIKQQEEAKRRIKELEIKAIRSQMNPHFIFNALNSIQSLINGNQFKEANIYLSKFAVLLRGVLNNSEKGMVSLSDELKAVELYCQLEQLRFDFNFDISIAEDVNGDLIEIPGMIIQPLAENAVVHGISGKGDQGKLGIQVIRQKEHILIEVSDNGVGLSSKEKDSLSQKGFGLKLVEERINILNLEGKEARLMVRNIGNSQGTLATLIIPID